MSYQRLPCQYDRYGRVIPCSESLKVPVEKWPVRCRKAYHGHDGPHVWWTKGYRIEWRETRS